METVGLAGAKKRVLGVITLHSALYSRVPQKQFTHFTFAVRISGYSVRYAHLPFRVCYSPKV